MAVANVLPFLVTPGKGEEFAALIAEGKAISDRIGIATSIRFWQGTVGAAGFGGVTVVVEYENTEAFGRAIDATSADPEWQAFLQKFGASGAATPQPTQLVTEIAM